jgi:integrase
MHLQMVYLPSNGTAKVSHPVSINNLSKVSKQCLEIDDDIRWLVALILDIGMRLSEAVVLMISDIKIDSGIPHISLKPNPHRRLKKGSSERLIPLIGMSLWASNNIINNANGDYCFPRYTDSSRCKCNANSASAALNKWIKTVAVSDDVIHGLRHSFRDRLGAVETTSDMIDQLVGWTLRTVGQGYGDGYDLVLLHKYMKSIKINS